LETTKTINFSNPKKGRLVGVSHTRAKAAKIRKGRLRIRKSATKPDHNAQPARLLFDHSRSGLGADAVMIAGVARDANGANNFALSHNRNAAFHRDCAFQRHHAQSGAA